MERVKVLKKIRRSFILSYIIERLIIKDLLFLYIYLLYFFHFFLNFIDRSIFGIVKKKVINVTISGRKFASRKSVSRVRNWHEVYIIEFS